MMVMMDMENLKTCRLGKFLDVLKRTAALIVTTSQ